jgi:3-deoxy-manno-octulosonate cytidylyltransferase (CMP-KDO synthetase)
MTAIAVIPARYASVRFPGKMLADRTGKPLIQHVYEHACAAALVRRVLVATDDERIADAVRRFGGEVAMTRPDHPNGTSRLAEAAAMLDAELIVNVQGDEPEIAPRLIDVAVQNVVDNADCPMGTLASPFGADEDPADPNIVKVVLNRVGRALYFSRSLIPFDRDGGGEVKALKHVGLYVYQRDFLSKYSQLDETPLERCERLEQLRVLEHGYAITVAVAEAHFHGIDTPQQYEAFVARYNALHYR